MAGVCIVGVATGCVPGVVGDVAGAGVSRSCLKRHTCLVLVAVAVAGVGWVAVWLWINNASGCAVISTVSARAGVDGCARVVGNFDIAVVVAVLFREQCQDN